MPAAGAGEGYNASWRASRTSLALKANKLDRNSKKARALLDELRARRGTFGRGTAAWRLQLLVKLLGMRIERGEELVRLHDELLFAAAFPDNAEIHATAAAALPGFVQRVRRLGAGEWRKLDDSGIAGTVTTHAFLYDTARWLVQQRECVTIDWRAVTEPEQLDLLLQQKLFSIEVEAFDSGEFSTEEWVALASGKPAAQSLAWLLASAPARAADARGRVWRALYDNADLPIAWALGASRWSTSRNRAPVNRVFARRTFRNMPANVVAHVVTPLPSLKRLGRPLAEQWRDSAIAALAARAREVFPTVCASVDEIYLTRLGEGVDLCVLGVTHEHRLPLEANYGYVMFANSVPIGYGGVTTFGAQANTGINIFESFRRSEAAFLFVEALRAFRTLFGVTRFIVNPYQIGADNDEALISGSYWFYHRLGFRSRDPAIAAEADAETARNAKRRGRRSSLPVLRRLASTDVVLELPDAGGTALFEERWLLTLGRAVAKHFGPQPAGARLEHLEALTRELCVQLTGEKRPLRGDERAGAAHLVPVIALVRDAVAHWPAAERAALWEMVRLKGSTRERPFAQASRAHIRWWRTLASYCERLER
jgi:hypothetical protein